MRSQANAIEAPRAPDVGEPAPFFTAATDRIDRFSLDVSAGRWIVLMFFGTLSNDAAREALELAVRHRDTFNRPDASFWGVSVDTADRLQRGLVNDEPAMRYFWDFDCSVSRLYGVANDQYLKPAIFLIDPMFRIAMAEPIENTAQVLARLEEALAGAPAAADEGFAPVLTLPRVLEPQICELLIDYFRQGGPRPSGFMMNEGGRTIEAVNPMLKRRSDVMIEDEVLVGAIRTRLETRLFPMIRRALGWKAQHIERYLICRYGSEEQGFFFPHRDDATAGTAHRRFAVSLNLNADYDGGELRFPEFGERTYKPPSGGATVFACGMLHEATPVTRGERFTLVPFLYDDEDAKLRRANLSLIGAATPEQNRKLRRAQRRG